MRGGLAIKNIGAPRCQNGSIEFYGTLLPYEDLPGRRLRGAPVIELRRGPLDILLKRGLVSVSVPSSGRNKIFSRWLRMPEVSKLTKAYCASFMREENPVRRIVRKGIPFADTFYLCRYFFAPVLFLPLILVLLGQASYPARVLLYSAAAALAPAVNALAAVSCKNAFVNCRVSEDVIGIARGVLTRRIVHFPRGSTDAELTVESPFLRSTGTRAYIMCVGGAGMIPVNGELFCEKPDSRAVMRLDYCGKDSVLSEQYAVMTAAAALLTAIVSVSFINYYLTVIAAALPLLILMLRHTLAAAKLRGRPAAVLYRDCIMLNGVWGGFVVNARIGRDNIAGVSVSQSFFQRSGNLCTLTVKPAGKTRAVRCRNVDFSRVNALLPRICRGQQ